MSERIYVTLVAGTTVTITEDSTGRFRAQAVELPHLAVIADSVETAERIIKGCILDELERRRAAEDHTPLDILALV